MGQETDTIHINKQAIQLILDTGTMTIATSNQGIAWAAPVFFIAQKQFFYFFSNPSSRHILEALSSGQAAAAIYEESSQWQNLKGIQMSGEIKCVSNGLEAAGVIRSYVNKFPMIKSFFTDISNMTLDTFISRFNTRLYSFIPESIYFMDNSIEFGFRKEIKLTDITL